MNTAFCRLLVRSATGGVVVMLWLFPPGLSGQPIKAQDDLILPVNPQKRVTSSPNGDLPTGLGNALRIEQIKSELDAAAKAGLGVDHPKVKALFAQLAVLEARQPETDASKTGDYRATIARLEIELETARRQRDALTKQMLQMRDEVDALRKEVAELRKGAK